MAPEMQQRPMDGRGEMGDNAAMENAPPERNTTPGQFDREDHERFLRRTFRLAREARASGHHPFGALLVAPDGLVLAEARNSVGSGDCTGHAETNLMRLASTRFEREVLGSATLYTSTEPCAMCAGAIYWGGVPRVVYALSERSLLALTGNDPANPTFDLPCREVFAHGQRPITVIGPLLEDEAREVHHDFWRR